MRYDYTPPGQIKEKKIDNTLFGQGCVCSNRNFCILLVHEQAILFVGIDTTEMFAYIHQRACISMFTTVLYKLAKDLKLPADHGMG